MSDRFEQAKAQRNALERLGERIPGFRGFQDRELRRDVDKLLREHLAATAEGLKRRLRELAAAYTDAGRVADLGPFDRLDRRLDGLAQGFRFADYGASGLFDPVKIDEAALTRLYEHDLSMLDDLGTLGERLAAVPAPGAGEPREALDAALAVLREAEVRWAGREAVITRVVAGAG